jgi:monoterpene epsilon-lactone hydrolase
MRSFRSRLCRMMVTSVLAPKFKPGISVDRQREALDKFARRAILPAGTRTEHVNADGVTGEWISVNETVRTSAILYLHGGAYNMGSARTHRELAARISKAAGARSLLINYRLAPEYPYPAALEDAVTAYRWLLKNGYSPDKIVIAGDSAGGGLTIATLLVLRDSGIPLPSAAVCLSPWANLEEPEESMSTGVGTDPFVSPDWLESMAHNYVADCDPHLPLISPVHADFRGLPPILIQVGSDETLLSDSTRLAGQGRKAGVKVTLDVWENMWHVWHMFAAIMPEAKRAVNEVGEFVKTHIGSAEVNHAGRAMVSARISRKDEPHK